MNQPVLSICIPTLNRSVQLEKTIKSIVMQKEFQDGRVEVVICDNASVDETETVVRRLVNEYPQIVYHRNETNIGNANFPLVLSMGKGRLRKLNNDTLVHKVGSLQLMCSIAEQYEKTRPVIFWGNSSLKCSSSDLVDFNTFISSVSYWVTWIGGFSIWENDCENLAGDTNGCEERLWQVRKTCELASVKEKCLIINDSFGDVQEPAKKNFSYGLYHVFYENFTGFLRPYLINGKLKQEVFDNVEKDLLFDFFTNWIILWEAQITKYTYSEEEDLKELVFKQYENQPYWQEFLKYYRRQKAKYLIKEAVKRVLKIGN